jgi:anti-sigma factor ChrR (cupin superfamily)
MSRFVVGDEADSTAPRVVDAYFEPGATASPHTHSVDYAEIILEGTQTVGRTLHGVGDVRVARAGTVYGPLVAGPEGCRVLLIFAGDGTTPVPPRPGQQVTTSIKGSIADR